MHLRAAAAVALVVSLTAGCVRTLRSPSDAAAPEGGRPEGSVDRASERAAGDAGADAPRDLPPHDAPVDARRDQGARDGAAREGAPLDAKAAESAPLDAARDHAAEGPANAPASAALQFPLPVALTTAATLPVRGTASDPDGIAAVRVNGIAASSSDGFATWSALVPLPAGPTTLAVTVEDKLGKLQATSATATIARLGAVLMRTADVAPGPAGDRALLLDVWGKALIEVELASGVLAPRSDEVIGSGPAFGPAASSVAWNGGPTAYVAGTGAVIAVELATGNRSTLSSGSVGAIRLQPSKGRAILVAGSELQAMALAGGARTTISSATAGSGPALAAPGRLAVDDANDRALVVDGSLKAIFEVKLANGQRTILSGGGVGSGPALSSPAGIALDAGAQNAYVVDGANLLAVQLATGARSVVSSGASLGPPFAIPQGAAMHPDGRVLVVNAWPAQLLGVTVATGARALLASTQLGSGPSLWVANALAVEPSQMRAVVLEPGAGASHTVELASGNRDRLFKPGSTGASLDTPGGGAIDAAGGRVLTTDAGQHGLFSVALATGTRTPVSTGTLGGGSVLASPAGVELDLLGGRALLVDRSVAALFSVQLSSGDRTILSGGAVGAGPAFSDPADLALDLLAGRAYVVDRKLNANAGAVVRVELASGARTLLAGAGPTLSSLRSVAFQGQTKQLLVLASSSNLPCLFRMDPVSGDHALVSGATLGLGPRFIIPSDVVSFPGRVSLVVDEWANAIFAVDEVSGDRVIVSH